MNREVDIDNYVKDPYLLVELIKGVIESLGNGQDESSRAEMEAQLREVANAVDNLDKIGVPVPAALSAEKTRLTAALGVQGQIAQVLDLLTDDLDEIVRDLKFRLGRSIQVSEKKPRARRSNSPKTDNQTLRRLLIEALRSLGGSSNKNEVLKSIEQELAGQLLPGDLEWRESSNGYAWQNNVCWERFRLIGEGVVKAGSPRGVWELNELRG